MIVCSCNVLSDYEVRTVVSTATYRTPSHVYGCLGCRVQCGRCAHTIRKIMDEVPDPAKIGSRPGNAVHVAPPANSSSHVDPPHCGILSSVQEVRSNLLEFEPKPRTGAR